MPLPRMTTRRWMIAVAGLALLMTLVVFLRRRTDNWVAMVNHGKLEQAFLMNIIEVNRVARARPQFAAELQSDLAFHRRRAEYHRSMKQKYRHLMSRPWLPVPPDPLEPE